MKRLLLASSSTVHATGYLDHLEERIRTLFAGAARVLFVPYALADRDAYARKAGERFARMGLGLDSIHQAPDPVAAAERAEGIFVGGGNTFRLLQLLYAVELLAPIRRRVLAGVPYLGSSAGSNVACPTIRTTNDMPIVYPPSFEALGLIPLQINPHYLDPDPVSTHMGETRDQRIAEFLEEDATPVLGLREGAMLIVAGASLVVEGAPGGKLFLPGAEPRACPPGTRLESLLAQPIDP